MTIGGFAAVLLHALLMAAAALGLAGLLPWLRAQLAGYRGPSLLQTWYDWRRLLRKDPVVAEAVSPLFTAAPVIALAASVAAALLVPSFTLGMATAPMADLLVIGGLLALARAVLILAAFDTGTTAIGLAGLRSLRLGALAEPALMLIMLTVALLTGSTNLDFAAGALRDTAFSFRVPLALAICALAILALAADTDDGAVAADYTGWHLAAIEAAMALRRLVWLSLIACLVLPGGLAPTGSWPLAWLLGAGAWLVKLAVLGTGLAVVGPILRRAGNPVVPSLAGGALLLVLLAVLFLFAGQGLA
jgi:formate hydrogenlyase subunit 4